MKVKKMVEAHCPTCAHPLRAVPANDTLGTLVHLRTCRKCKVKCEVEISSRGVSYQSYSWPHCRLCGCRHPEGLHNFDLELYNALRCRTCGHKHLAPRHLSPCAYAG